MDLFTAAARAFAMDEAAWRRHANPWSGWTRVFGGLPLICLAIWSRVWIGGWALVALACVALWLWLNPRLFPPPAHLDAWISRGVMGEKVFLEHRAQIPAHHRRAALLLSWLSLPGTLVMAWGLWALWPSWVVFGALLTALPKLWFIDRMVWMLGDWERAGGQVWRDG